MIPWRTTAPRELSDIPRASGDDPDEAQAGTDDAKYSPRERG